jgi:hypothetical protein
MTLALSPLLQRFAERTPLPVMVRGILERCLNPAQLDAWFERVAQRQYTRTLLFSTVFDLLTQVVCRQQPAVKAAYQASLASVGVSLTSVYNKLNGLEPSTSAALVRYSAEQAQTLCQEMPGAARAPLLAGYEVRVLDGNVLGVREHRLMETRTRRAAPLPGKSLVVFDPALDLILDLVPSEDAYTQERALLEEVLPKVQPGELWLMDRNLAPKGFQWGLIQRGAHFLAREHEQLRFTPLEPMHKVGRCDSGWVSEQRVRVQDGPHRWELRRLRLDLDQPTREGETTLYLLTSLPPEAAEAPELAELYLTRWTVEKALLHLTVQLQCEINTLGYPRAALFGFACAAVAFNVLGVVKAALRAAHGVQTVDQEVSGYYLVNDLVHQRESLEAMVDEEDWAVFRTATATVLAAWLVAQAAQMNLRRYRKHARGPKKAPPKRVKDPKHPHLSIARLLAERTQARSHQNP